MLKFLFFNQFQDHHLSRITHAGSQLQNTSVTTIAGRKTRSDLIEEALDHLVISKLGDNQTAGMHLLRIITGGAIARNGNETFRFATNRVGLGACGLDTLVYEKLFDKVTTECYTCTCCSSKSIT